jgi:tetratricopeptide (TPR) repeat protein
MGLRQLWVVAAWAVSCVATVAHAESDTERAKALFEQARKLDESGSYEQACPLYKRAVELEPNAVGGKFHLARCYERAGKMATAVAQYREAKRAAATAGQAERAQYAREQIELLSRKTPMLTIHVPDDMRREPGLKVTRNDETVPPEQWDSPQPVDAGEYVVRASAQGKADWKGTVTAKAGTRTTIEVKLSQAGIPVWAWITGGIGLAFGGVAVAFAVDQVRTQSSINSHCPKTASGDLGPCDRSDGFDPATANARLDRALGLALGFGITGAALVTAGIVGIATAPRATTPKATGSVVPWLGPRGAGVLISWHAW